MAKQKEENLIYDDLNVGGDDMEMMYVEYLDENLDEIDLQAGKPEVMCVNFLLDSNKVLQNELNRTLSRKLVTPEAKEEIFKTLARFGISLQYIPGNRPETGKDGERREILNRIDNQLDGIQEQIDNIDFVKNQVMGLILKRLGDRLDVSLPIDSTDSLTSLDQKLDDKTNIEQMRQIALNICKPKLKVGVGFRYGLKTFIHDDVLKLYSWWGDEDHLCFEELRNLNKILFECWRDDDTIVHFQDYIDLINVQLVCD